MKIIEPSFEILTELDAQQILKHLESAGRTCYKSQDRAKDDPGKFIKRIIDDKHESVLEHFSLSVKLVCDRGVMTELTRHRHASFSIESTRYVKYKEIGVIAPADFEHVDTACIWESAMEYAENSYRDLLFCGIPAEIARSVLPNALATEMVMTANLREWRHILKLRTAKTAHPQMRDLMVSLCLELQKHIPVIFDDILVPKIKLIKSVFSPDKFYELHPEEVGDIFTIMWVSECEGLTVEEAWGKGYMINEDWLVEVDCV